MNKGQEIENWANNLSQCRREARRLQTKVDELEKEAGEAKREAEYLAATLYRRYYKGESSDWELCDTTAGVITQIDNMVAGIGQERGILQESEAALKVLAERQYEAIKWALGYYGFPQRKEGQGAYWWRTELRSRSGFIESSDNQD